MKDMTKTELIELVAGVSLRISAFIYAIAAFRYLYQFSYYLSQNSDPAIRTFTNPTIRNYIRDISFDALISVVMFLLTVPLARLLCRGLLLQLEAKPLE
jgi:uncharacterized protein YggT (Ycf19 family)